MADVSRVSRRPFEKSTIEDHATSDPRRHDHRQEVLPADRCSQPPLSKGQSLDISSPEHVESGEFTQAAS